MEYMIVLVLTALLTGWLVLQRTAQVQGRPSLELFADLFRPDLDRRPIAAKAINKSYQKVMRKSGDMGPAGIVQPRKHVVILTPEEDYDYIRSFGISDFEAQLLEYVQGYAREEQWVASDSTEPSSIHFALDPKRKRLRPSLSLTGSTRTEFLAPASATPLTEPIDAYGGISPAAEAATAPYVPVPSVASISYEGLVTELPPAAGKLTVGRKEGNDIVIDHEHFSRTHLALWPENGKWMLEVVTDNTNATSINGSEVRGVTALADGDRIDVGKCNPLIFSISQGSS